MGFSLRWIKRKKVMEIYPYIMFAIVSMSLLWIIFFPFLWKDTHRFTPIEIVSGLSWYLFVYSIIKGLVDYDEIKKYSNWEFNKVFNTIIIFLMVSLSISTMILLIIYKNELNEEEKKRIQSIPALSFYIFLGLVDLLYYKCSYFMHLKIDR